MRNDYYVNSKDYINRWVVSYADFVTMLLALFMVMYAVMKLDNQRLAEFNKHMQEKFSGVNIENVTKYQALNASDVEKILSENVSKTDSINILKSQKGIIIRLKNKYIFDEGKAVVKDNSKKTLDEIVTVLTKIDNPVIIEGHTDSTPIKNAQYPSNWELSTARATNIISYIVKTGKISPKRLSAVGYGEYEPIADNSNINGRMLNRRVDIVVLDKK